MSFLEKISPALSDLFVSAAVVRLLLAAFLGAVVGLEREIHHRAAGLRTITLISVGAALFTVISEALGRLPGAAPTHIAANVVTGIGFLGAGSIIHSRGSVTGLTTAAIIFVTASIGMASGAGMYAVAVFATLIVLVGLYFLHRLESGLRLRPRPMTYVINTRKLEDTVTELNTMLDEEQLSMQHVRFHRMDDGLNTVEFTLEVPEELERQMLNRFSEMRTVVNVGQSERNNAE